MKSEKNGVVEILVSDIVFRQDLYPRLETSTTTVQKYAEDLSVLPPVEVNQRNELIDGWHRWTAHKKAKAEKIRAKVTETASDAELLELAIRRNATHGLQLSQEDKRDMARKIYEATPEKERAAKKEELASILSVSERTIRDWLSRIDKDAKERQKQQAFDLWLSCRTQEDIANELGWSQPSAAGFLKSFIKNGKPADVDKSDDSEESGFTLTKSQKADSEHATDFQVPIYNIWKQQEKSAGSKHFGNTEVRLLDNLLYLYTSPFDVVIDPFAGGGSTIDVCRKRLRRYWVSDRKPIVEASSDGVPLHKQVRQWDVTDGVPPLSRWQDVRLAYLDPPYWKQAEGQYSDDPTDLANMELEKFTETLSGLVKAFAKKMSSGSHIALIIQPTQWKAPEKRFTDHVGDMLRAVKLPVKMRISCPYESQQCTAQMVDWAKENKNVLVLTREIVVWEVA